VRSPLAQSEKPYHANQHAPLQPVPSFHPQSAQVYSPHYKPTPPAPSAQSGYHQPEVFPAPLDPQFSPPRQRFRSRGRQHRVAVYLSNSIHLSIRLECYHDLRGRAGRELLSKKAVIPRFQKATGQIGQFFPAVPVPSMHKRIWSNFSNHAPWYVGKPLSKSGIYQNLVDLC
jgi:hypothetical protein